MPATTAQRKREKQKDFHKLLCLRSGLGRPGCFLPCPNAISDARFGQEERRFAGGCFVSDGCLKKKVVEGMVKAPGGWAYILADLERDRCEIIECVSVPF
jgi:hypothetical protein